MGSKLSVEEYYNFIGAKVNVSNEYNAMDWPDFFLGSLSKLYRGLTNNAKLTIKNPGMLISLFTGKWTTFGQIIQYAYNPVKFYTLWDIVDHISDKGKKAAFSSEAVLKGTPNIYQELIVNYKKIKQDDIEKYKADFERFKVAIQGAKKVYCNKTQPTKLTTSQLTDLKLFRPKEIKTEIERALTHYVGFGPEWKKFSEDVVSWINSNIVDYLLENIHDPDGYVKK